MTLSNCSQRDKPDNYIERFRKHEDEFKLLVKQLQFDSFANSQRNNIVRSDKFRPEIERSLKRLVISHVYIYYWKCSKQSQFDFLTKWAKDRSPAHLYFNICDSVNTRNKYYNKKTNSDEAFGLGENWSLWIDHANVFTVP